VSADAERVLMTADAVGGVWTYALELARVLARGGTRVLLAVEGPAPGPARRAEAKTVPGLTLVELGGRLEWMADCEADLDSAGAALLGLAADFAPDVVHVNGYAHAALPWGRPVVAVAHSCVRSWWRAVHQAEPPPAWDGYLARVRRGLDAADVVVAPTRSFLREIEGLYRPASHCVAVYNGRRPEPFAPAEKAPFVFAAGRLWDEAKNLAAVAAVAGALPWPVRVAGPGAVSGAVESLGTLDAAGMAATLARAAIYAAPGRYEPFGLGALEAALSGCALVLGDLPSQRELWGDAAVYVDPDDTAALQAALRLLIADQPRRRALAAAAHRRARCYCPEAMAAGYRAVYELAAATHRSQPGAARPCASSSSATR